MKPEDKVTADEPIADRLTAAGTTQTPLTDGLSERIRYVVAKLDKLNPDYAAYEFVVPACYFRKQELALAASKAREAELVKAARRMIASLDRAEAAKEDVDEIARAVTDQISAEKELRTALQSHTAALTAPPTNSKEMNK